MASLASSARCEDDEGWEIATSRRSDLEAEPPAVARESQPEDPRSGGGYGVAVAGAASVLAQALEASREHLAADRSVLTLREARDALLHDPGRASALTRRVLEVPQPAEVADRAHWIAGLSAVAESDFEGAYLAWQEVGTTPVPDHLQVHRIEALLALERPREALDLATDILDRPEAASFPTVHRLRELNLICLYRSGHTRAFLREASAMLERYPQYRRLDRLWLWMGQASLQMGEAAEAAGWFDRVSWTYPYRATAHQAQWSLQVLHAVGVAIPSHSVTERFERARRLSVDKHWRIAEVAFADLLAEVIERQGETELANEIRMEMWRNAYGSNNYSMALAILQEIRANGSRGLGLRTVLTAMASTYARLGQFDAGLRIIEQRDQGMSAATRHTQLARYYLDNGFFDEALEHTRQASSPRERQGWDWALLLFTAGEYSQAAAQFEALVERRGGGSADPRNRYWWARALEQSGDPEQARELFEETRQRWPLSYYGIQATNRLWELDRRQDGLARGQGEMRNPCSGEGNDGSGSVEREWRSGDHPISLSGIDPTATATGELDPTEPETLEQLAGRLVRDLDLTLSFLVDRRTLSRSPALARESCSSWVRPARIHWEGPAGLDDSWVSLTTLEHEVSGAFVEPLAEDGLRAFVDRSGDLFPAMTRAEFLYGVGEREASRVESREASLEFRLLDRRFGRRPAAGRPVRLDERRHALLVDKREDPRGIWGIELGDWRYPAPGSSQGARLSASRQQAIYDHRADLREDFVNSLMIIGDYNMIRRFDTERLNWDDRPPGESEWQRWSIVYPRGFSELVVDWSAFYEVNPYIMWSLMGVESAFNPDSISRSDARGLLQVIPKTGELIALGLGDLDFGTDDLLDPATSIRFGCYYFGQLMAKFDGQELLAFAAYNAGPHNVARWLEGWGELPMDAFVEMIPRQQPREYVKKVMRHLALYRMFYLGEDSLYVGQDLDPSYEDNIHF